MQKIGDSIAWVIEHVQGFSSGTVEMIEKVGAVILAVGALGAAFTLLSGPAGPIILISMAVLALIELYDKLEKKQEAINKQIRESTPDLISAASSYEEYKRAAVDAAVGVEGFAAGTRKGQEHMERMVKEGLIVSRVEFDRLRGDVDLTTMAMSDNAEIQARLADESKYGLEPAIRGVSSGFMEAAARLEKYANIGEMLPAVSERVVVSMDAVQDSLQKALSSEKVTDQLIKIQQAIGKQEQAMLTMQTKYDADVTKKQFEHNHKMLLAQQKYDQEYALLIAKGRTDEANKLTAQFNRTKTISQREYAAAQKLQQIALVRKQIERVRANIVELQGMRDQTLRVMQEQIKAEIVKSGQLTKDQAKTLRLIAQAGSEQLRKETEFYIARTKAFVDYGKTKLHNAQTIADGISNITTEEDAAEVAIGVLEGQLFALQNELDDLPPMTLPPLDLPDVPSAADISAVTEPATTAMSQVVNDIAQAVSAAKDAIADLVEFQLPAGVETGLERVAEFITMAVEGFYAIHDAIAPKIVNVKEILGPAKQLLDVVTAAVKAMSGFGTDETLSLPDMAAWGDQLRAVLGAITDVILDLQESEGRWEVVGAGNLAGSIIKVVSIIKPGIDALASLADYTDAVSLTATMTAFVQDLAEVAYWINDMAVRYSFEVTPDAKAWLADVQEIVKVIKPGVDALASLADYTDAVSLTATMTAFVQDLAEVAYWINDMADRYSFDVTLAAKTWLADVQEIVKVIKPGIDALASLKDYTDAASLTTTMTAFTQDLAEVAYWIDNMADLYGFEVTQAAKDWLANVQEIVKVIEPGIKALASLGELVAVENVAEKIDTFVEQLRILAYTLNNAATRVSRTDSSVIEPIFAISDVAIAFWEGARDLVKIIEPGVKALTAITDLARVEDLGAQIDIFVEQVIALAYALNNAATRVSRIDSDLIEPIFAITEQAQTFWEQAQSIIKVIEPGVKALASLGEYVGIKDVGAIMDSFIEQMKTIAIKLNEFATGEGWESGTWFEIADTTLTWLTNIQKIIGVIEPGVGALAALGEYVKAKDLTAKVDDFVEQIKTVAIKLNEFATGEGWESGTWFEIETSTLTWIENVKKIVGLIEPGIKAIASLAGYTKVWNLKKKWAEFEDDLWFVTVRIAGLAETMSEEYIPDATAFRDGMKAIQELFKEGIGYLGGVGVEGIDSVLLAIDRFKVSLWRLMGSLGDTVSRGLTGIHDAIYASIPAATTAGFAYGLALGNSIVQGYMAGIGQLPSWPQPGETTVPRSEGKPGRYGSSGDVNNNVNVNLYGNINNGLDWAAAQGQIRQTVRDAMRG